MFKQYIDGRLAEGLGKPLDVTNPADGTVVETFGQADAEQAREALSAAKKAFGVWRKTPVSERINWILRLRDACLKEKDYMIDLVMAEGGLPYSDARGDFDWCMNSFAYYAEEVKRVYGVSFPSLNTAYGGAYHIAERRPLGVAVGHLAWNYPLGNAGLKIGPSVVSGCACVIKPSSQTPLSALYLGAIASKIGFPPGVINIISGPSSQVARALNESDIPKLITLIGSTETGRRIMSESAASVKKYSFELGGNAPAIVMNDADIDQTAQTIVAKKTSHAGQTCVNFNRIYVHESVYEQLAQNVKRRLEKVKLGSGKDIGNVMGPLINREARDRMLELIGDAVSSGARLITGGMIPDEFASGSFMTPALLMDVNDRMRVSKEEIFGPIIPLQPFTDINKAIEQANDTQLGLSAYFFGHDARDIRKVYEGLEAGEVFVNGCPGSEQTPHAGTKQSGVGCDRSHWSLEEYFDFKVLSMIP